MVNKFEQKQVSSMISIGITLEIIELLTFHQKENKTELNI